MGKYDDIIRMERPVSRKHPPMERAARAKQFMPFAALTGFEGLLAERERIFVPCPVPGEDERTRMDAALRRVAGLLAEGIRPAVSLSYFMAVGRQDEDGIPMGLIRDAAGTADKLNSGRLRVGGAYYPIDALTALCVTEDAGAGKDGRS